MSGAGFISAWVWDNGVCKIAEITTSLNLSSFVSISSGGPDYDTAMRISAVEFVFAVRQLRNMGRDDFEPWAVHEPVLRRYPGNKLSGNQRHEVSSWLKQIFQMSFLMGKDECMNCFVYSDKPGYAS